MFIPRIEPCEKPMFLARHKVYTLENYARFATAVTEAPCGYLRASGRFGFPKTVIRNVNQNGNQRKFRGRNFRVTDF